MAYKIKVQPRPAESQQAVALHWLDRWVVWETRHRRLLVPLVIGLVVVVGATGGGWGWWWWQNRQAEIVAGRAAQHYPASTEAMAASSPDSPSPTPADRCAKAVPLYQEISTRYGWSRLAPLALYYQANCQVELGRPDEAVPLYQRIVVDYSANDDVTAYAAARLGYLYATQGNRAGAIEQFRRITQQSGAPNRDHAYFEMGRLEEAGGQRDTALAAYQAVVKEFPKSPWAAEAIVRIKHLGGEVPVPPAAAAPQPLTPAAPSPTPSDTPPPAPPPSGS
jgi:predicted negative regulator of RcsB-dependent stress response